MLLSRRRSRRPSHLKVEPSGRSAERTLLKCHAAATVDPLRVGGLRGSTVLRVTSRGNVPPLVRRQAIIWLALCTAIAVGG